MICDDHSLEEHLPGRQLRRMWQRGRVEGRREEMRLRIVQQGCGRTTLLLSGVVIKVGGRRGRILAAVGRLAPRRLRDRGGLTDALRRREEVL